MLLSVLPIAVSGTIPGFQQDWYWPSNRAFVWTWLSDWIGQWSSKGLGQPNLLPMETPIVLLQSALIYVFGPSVALAAYLLVCGVAGALGITALLKRLQLCSPVAGAACGIYYGIGPVFFIRVQAGHLAYIAAYALLPWIVALAFDIQAGLHRRWITLSILCALAYAQIQFMAYIPLALLVWAAVYCRRWKAAGLVAFAIAAGAVWQLQGLLPLLMSGSRTFYLAERPLQAWLLNLSAKPIPALAGAGYFVPYYERAALPAAIAVILALIACAAVIAAFRFGRTWVFAASLLGIGWLISTGIRGPLGAVFAWSFTAFTPLDVLRDFHYAAVLTELGSALFIAYALSVIPRFAYVALPAVVYAVVPSFIGMGLLRTGVPHPFLSRMSAEASFMSAHGSGPVLWLPAEGPLALRAGESKGRDPAMYTYRNVPFVGDSRDLRIVSQIDNTLHAGKVPIELLRRAGIRYIVTRPGLVSSRTDTLGTSIPLGFAGKTTLQIAHLLAHAAGITTVARFGDDRVFEVAHSWPRFSVRPAVSGPLLFSQLPPGTVTVLPRGVKPLSLHASLSSPDPTLGWASSYEGAWLNPWLDDSIYPYVFTLSQRKLRIASSAACLAVAGPNGRWSLNSRRLPSPTAARGLQAATGLQESCGIQSAASVLVALSSYDASWRALVAGRWRAPLLVDGWAMGWPTSAKARLLYLPTLVQVLSAALDAAAVALFALRLGAPKRGSARDRSSKP